MEEEYMSEECEVESVSPLKQIEEPRVGKTFCSVDEMFDYYKNYGKQKGFPVSKRTSKRNDDGEIKYVTFECSQAGKTRSKSIRFLKPYPNMKIGCKAKLRGCLGVDGLWTVSSFKSEHNHGMSPGKSRLFRCYRKISTHVKKRLEVNDRVGIRMNKNFNSLVVEAGGHENLSFMERDCRNYIENIRRLQLKEGDATAIQSYFLKMQSQSSDFFFSMDLDENGILRNVFWADSRSRAAYREYGEAVTFDTTYLVNKYDMPFAPFVGVNHHGHSILLGCALISREDTETFTWVFQTWLACMSGCPPGGIITDQDRAMKAAIEIVFPNTRHRWCLWHIMKKMPEKLRSYKQYASISFSIHNAVYDSQSAEEYEERWNLMIENFNLRENEWLAGLFSERHRWVPCFVKDRFWAGMSTTQRSESINAFFDGYVHSKTSLRQFVEQYGNALASKIEKEYQEDTRSQFKLIPCATTYDMEKQVQEVYTIEKFKEFQLELVGKMYCDFLSINDSGIISEYDIREDVLVGEVKRRVVFKVFFERDTSQIICSCKRFEFRGILCRHALAVLLRNDILKIPDKYIFRHWHKDIRRCHSRVKTCYEGLSATTEQLRFEKMQAILTEVADLAAINQKECDDVMDWAVAKMKNLSLKAPNMDNGYEPQQSVHDIVLDPIVTRGKGHPPNKRKESGVFKKQNRRKKNNLQKTAIDVIQTQESIVQKMDNRTPASTFYPSQINQTTLNFDLNQPLSNEGATGTGEFHDPYSFHNSKEIYDFANTGSYGSSSELNRPRRTRQE